MDGCKKQKVLPCIKLTHSEMFVSIMYIHLHVSCQQNMTRSDIFSLILVFISPIQIWSSNSVLFISLKV